MFLTWYLKKPILSEDLLHILDMIPNFYFTFLHE